MFDISCSGFERRPHRVRKSIAGRETREICCAPHVAASSGVAAVRHLRNSRRHQLCADCPERLRARRARQRDPRHAAHHVEFVEPGRREVHGPARAERDDQRTHAVGERAVAASARSSGAIIASSSSIHLDEIEAAAPLGDVGKRTQCAQAVGLHGEHDRVQVAVDQARKSCRSSCALARSSSNPLMRFHVQRIEIAHERRQPDPAPTQDAAREDFAAALRICIEKLNAVVAVGHHDRLRIRRDALQRSPGSRAYAARGPRRFSPGSGHELPFRGKRRIRMRFRAYVQCRPLFTTSALFGWRGRESRPTRTCRLRQAASYFSRCPYSSPLTLPDTLRDMSQPRRRLRRRHRVRPQRSGRRPRSA